MPTVDSLLERNRAFAHNATQPVSPSLPDAMPSVKAIIIGCADMRVDPALILGLHPGEAVVMRNIGGRVTPGLLQQLGLLGAIGQATQSVPGGGGEFNVIVLHHTDCGITRLAASPQALAPFFGVAEGELGAKAVLDPRKSVQVDVDVLRSIEALPASWLLSGLVYDVTTGKVEVVVPPAPFRG
jgi:carbonic anhydrase